MFTGIIREIGRIAKKTAGRDGAVTLLIKSKKIRPALGESVCVDGVCLTVSGKTRIGFRVDVVPETLKRSNLGEAGVGAMVNLEPSLKLKDALNGHFVLGHVDGVCRVVQMKRQGKAQMLALELPTKLSRFIVEKGSVAINGVSLTVASRTKKLFTVAIIPFTEKQTNLGNLRPKDRVNIEIDVLARYAQGSP